MIAHALSPQRRHMAMIDPGMDYLFYDLETFGQDPRRTRIAQFAGVRCDPTLTICQEPQCFYVQPADDLLPSPEATLITGILPQHAYDQGLCEAQAFAHIHALMTQSPVCVLGYNSLRFDDAFIRYGLFRQFYDPYGREYQNGNSRWDLLDLMRLAYALRPEGIVWPKRADGAVSFRLEDLAAANGVRDGLAHDALSDVLATIGLAQRLRAAQPRLWEYAQRFRDHSYSKQLLDSSNLQPVLHIAFYYAATCHCASIIAPLMPHPTQRQRILVVDLAGDLTSLPTQLANAEPNVYPPGLHSIACNQAPVLIPWRYLDTATRHRLKIDPANIWAKVTWLRQHQATLAQAVHDHLTQPILAPATPTPNDVDGALYDRLIAPADAARCQQVRMTAPTALAQLTIPFTDSRLAELLWRYRARNWPQTLTVQEQTRWHNYRRERLCGQAGLSEFTFTQYDARLAELRASHAHDENRHALLAGLQDWATQLAQTL